MRPVLFVLPIHAILQYVPDLPLLGLLRHIPDIPVYTYGVMLFLSFIFCSWLAARLFRKYEGVTPNFVSDLALWVMGSGIVGGRLLFLAENWREFLSNPWILVSKSGLILYGALIGGAVGFSAYHWLVLRKRGISYWKAADVVAPCLALGICLGRLGCLATGCCFGNIACPGCPAVHFPDSSLANQRMIQEGKQAAFGFVMSPEEGQIEAVEPGSAAAEAGLKVGDILLAVNGQDIHERRDGGKASLVSAQQGLRMALSNWPEGKLDVALRVRGADGQARDLPPFVARGLGVHPTQLYESISMILLLFFLVSYYPFKVRDGSVMVLFLFCYAVHRFINELLRTDNQVVAFGMTLSQNISLLVLAAAVVLGILVWRSGPPSRSREDEEKSSMPLQAVANTP